MVRVYHNSKFLAFPIGATEAPPIPRDQLTFVAVVDSDSFDEAFRLTNHIDRPWWRNAGVRRVGGPKRSTSVGDVLLRGDNEWVAVMPVGFAAVTVLP